MSVYFVFDVANVLHLIAVREVYVVLRPQLRGKLMDDEA
jgi:hypothetical protein